MQSQKNYPTLEIVEEASTYEYFLKKTEFSNRCQDNKKYVSIYMQNLTHEGKTYTDMGNFRDAFEPVDMHQKFRKNCNF